MAVWEAKKLYPAIQNYLLHLFDIFYSVVNFREENKVKH
jgi:hypothetical protein